MILTYRKQDKRRCRLETEKIGGGLSENNLYPFPKYGRARADIARVIGVSRPTVCVSLKALVVEGSGGT